MTLSKEDLALLSAPFPASDHEFLNGNAYISEEAITSRIESVDAGWQFFIQNLIQRGNSVSVMARMEIKAVSRENTGMSQVVMTTKGDREANEAEKSATTDALKRCARLFGVGRYLLRLPKTVTDVRTLEAHLKSLDNSTPIWWRDVTRALSEHESFKNKGDYLPNALKLLLRDGALNNMMAAEQVLAIVALKYPKEKPETNTRRIS